MAERPSVDRYFMDMTHLVKSRGTCPRRQVGAVVVKEKHVLTTGYNGAPKGFPHPVDTGCIRDELKIPSGSLADVCPCLHAEQNALLQAAMFGVSVSGADLYCTTQPCTQCSRMIANSGIRRVIFHEEYADPLAIGLLTTAGVEIWQWDTEAGDARPYTKTNTWEEAQDRLRREYRERGTLNGAREPGLAPLREDAPHAPGPERPGAGAAPHSLERSEAPGAATGEADDDADLDADDGPPEGRTKIRDLSEDPRREELLRRLAKERVERERRS